MQLTIGETAITITSCTRRRDLQRGYYLDIKIPKENTTMDALDTLLTGNAQDIAITEDDGTEVVYRGFKEFDSIVLKNGEYEVMQYCTSEMEAQLSLARNEIAAVNTNVAAQAEQMAVTEETVAMQMVTMDSLLVDVIPAIITDAVTAAIQDALASNSTTEVAE